MTVQEWTFIKLFLEAKEVLLKNLMQKMANRCTGIYPSNFNAR